jgi:hypothetical protein
MVLLYGFVLVAITAVLVIAASVIFRSQLIQMNLLGTRATRLTSKCL